MSLKTARVSCFRSVYDPRPNGQGTLGQILWDIASNHLYKAQITTLRRTLQQRGPSAYAADKRRLPAFCPGGTFTPTRAKDHLIRHSGLVHVDYDHLPAFVETWEVLCGDPYVVYVFRSPSGCGLKVGVPVPLVADDQTYKHAWQAVSGYFERQYGLVADPTGKDICRLCFVSWDPDAYVHFGASVFPVPSMRAAAPPPATVHTFRQSPPAGDRRKAYLDQAITRAIALIESSRPPTHSMPGTRHHARLKAARLLGGYVGGHFLTADDATAILARVVKDNTEDFEAAMRTIADGLRHGMCTPVTYETLEQERLAWCAARGYTPQPEEDR